MKDGRKVMKEGRKELDKGRDGRKVMKAGWKEGDEGRKKGR
jgi:hypothetical protein